MYSHVNDVYIARAKELSIAYRIDADTDTLYIGNGFRKCFRLVHYKDSTVTVFADIPVVNNMGDIEIKAVILGEYFHDDIVHPEIVDAVFISYKNCDAMRKKYRELIGFINDTNPKITAVS